MGLIEMPVPDPTSSDEATIYLLYGLVRYLRPALVVEAGTYRGHAACAMGLALRDGDIDGEVWTADVADFGVQDRIRDNALERYVKCYTGDFGAMLEGPLAGRSWRMAFVDSGPADGVSTATDIRATHAAAALKGLAPNGLMLVDDINGAWEGAEVFRVPGGRIALRTGKGMALVQS